MIRLSILPMPQAACAGKKTVHVVNPLFAVHYDIVQTTEKESRLRFLLWITLKARILDLSGGFNGFFVAVERDQAPLRGELFQYQARVPSTAERDRKSVV